MQQDLAQKIYKGDKDSFILPYSSMVIDDSLLPEEKAFKNLKKNHFLFGLINKLKLLEIDSLIGGSIPLSCVLKSSFETNDIDLYIKNVNLDILLKVENVIKELVKIKELIVVRGPLTITWHLTTIYNDYYIVQVNILKIESWAELFISYHSDIVCLGYDILKSQFVYLKGRWDNITINKSHSFSAIFNIDNPYTLKKACGKYKNRGFNCYIDNKYSNVNEQSYGYSVYFPPESLYFSSNEYQETVFGHNTLIKGNCTLKPIVKDELLYKLCLKYRGCTNIHFGKSVVENYISSIVPISAIGYINPITLEKNIINSDYVEFFESPQKFKKTVKVSCPICFNNYNIEYFIQQACHTIKKNVCSHLQSSLIFNGFDIIVPFAIIL